MTFIALIPPIYANIKQYGGDPSASSATNDAAVAAAISALGANGGFLFFGPGTWTGSPLILPNRVGARGAGMHATTYKLKNGANDHVIKNYVSPDGVIANAEFCGVFDLTIDGNKANQSGTSHGIFLSTFPLLSAATNDDDFDTHHVIANVFIKNALSDGFAASGRSATQLHNVQAYGCSGHGFSPSFDTELVGCVSGTSGVEGFYLANSSVRLTNCKAFYAGQVTPSLGYGYHLVSANGISLSSCEAQDNQASGYVLDTGSQFTLSSCVADSNGTSSAGSYPGLDLFSCTDSLVEGFVAYERKANGSTSYQTQALRMRSGSIRNRISLTHSATNGATIASPIMSGSNSLAGNDVRINSQAAFQTIAYAASITPDPFVGNVVEVTLTGALTINAPGNGPYVPGQTLTFILIQDGTGGRTMTFNAAYKTNWTPSTTAGKTNTIRFVYDGTSWWQQSAVTGV